jgi:uncharacterized membrane protein YbaN (DUF454 family)
MWIEWLSLGAYILAAIWPKLSTVPFFLPGLRFLAKMSLAELLIHTAIILLAMLFLMVNRWHSKKSISAYIRITFGVSMFCGLFLSIFVMCFLSGLICHARSLARELEFASVPQSSESIDSKV